MHTKVVYQAAKALSRIGCAVLRFNFRGAGASEGTFDNGAGEQEEGSDLLAADRALKELECWRRQRGRHFVPGGSSRLVRSPHAV